MINLKNNSSFIQSVELAESLADQEMVPCDPLPKKTNLSGSSRSFCWLRKERGFERSSEDLIADLSKRCFRSAICYDDVIIQTAIEKMKRCPKDRYEIYSSALKELRPVLEGSLAIRKARKSIREKRKMEAKVEQKQEMKFQAPPQIKKESLCVKIKNMLLFRVFDPFNPPSSSFDRDNINTWIPTRAGGKTTILHQIAITKRSELSDASKTVAMGADLNAQEDLHGNTPLLWAVANANNSMAKRLIELGKKYKANFDLQDSLRGNTAMHLLVAKGYREKSMDGERLQYSNLELIKDLIDAGADVNIQDARGNTPLHIACARRDEEACRLLISRGASTNIENRKKERPIDLLKYSYKKSLVMLSFQAGAFLLERAQHEDPKVVERIKALFSR